MRGWLSHELLVLLASHVFVRSHVCVYYQANNNGTSPAFIAAQNGHEQTVRVLAELNADLNQVTGECLLHG